MLLVTLMLALSLALTACGGGKISGSGTVNYSNGKVEIIQEGSDDTSGGSSKEGQAGSGAAGGSEAPENTAAEPGSESSGSSTDNGGQETPSEGSEAPLNNGGSDVTRALIARAAEMQDYSHAPGEDAAPITTIDDNILLLVNKTHPLGSKYWPDDLVTISRTVDGVGNADTKKMRKVAADAIEKMMADALAQGIDIRVRTGFRSYDYQTNLFNSYAQKNGEAEANTYSARAGESEHQTGYACDLGGKSEGYALSYKFGETAEGKWVYEHCSEYGFILRFIDGKTVDGVRQPGEITGYVYEPWHIRYVGVDAAKEIYERGICLEEYLGILD